MLGLERVKELMDHRDIPDSEAESMRSTAYALAEIILDKFACISKRLTTPPEVERTCLGQNEEQ
jgi:hypothetical protein